MNGLINTEKRPLISVIVIIYEVEPYLEKCLKSLVNQTYDSLQIILSVGIGGRDNSEKICDKYSQLDDRILIVKSEPRGVADARNQGMKYALGEWVSFVDGDDWYELDMFQKLINNALKYSADISICGKYEEFQGYSRRTKQRKHILMSPKEAFERILYMEDFQLHTWDKLFDKKLLQNIEFPMIKESEDRFVMYRIFDRAGRIIYDSNPLYHFRVREDSCSRTEKNAIVSLEADLLMCQFVEKKYKLSKPVNHYLFYSNYAVIASKVLYQTLDYKKDKDYFNVMRVYAKQLVFDSKVNFKTKLKAIICIINKKWLVAFIRWRNKQGIGKNTKQA